MIEITNSDLRNRFHSVISSFGALPNNLQLADCAPAANGYHYALFIAPGADPKQVIDGLETAMEWYKSLFESRRFEEPNDDSA